MAQRLIRVLCKECKRLAEPRDLDPKILRLVGHDARWRRSARRTRPWAATRATHRLSRAQGDLRDDAMNAQIRELAFNLAPVSDLRKAAIQSGMRSLVEDGKLKVLNAGRRQMRSPVRRRSTLTTRRARRKRKQRSKSRKHKPIGPRCSSGPDCERFFVCPACRSIVFSTPSSRLGASDFT
jgi:hypothetical protein